MPRGVYPRTEKHRRINSQSHSGLKRSPEAIVKFSETMKARYQDPEFKTRMQAAQHSPEALQRRSESNSRKWEEPGFREVMSSALRTADQDWYITKEGYITLRYQYDHPLASDTGELLEHRKILYEKIGPGEHECWWCGKLLVWGGSGGIHADHLDDDRANNAPENLVPSCKPCNGKRGGGLGA